MQYVCFVTHGPASVTTGASTEDLARHGCDRKGTRESGEDSVNVSLVKHLFANLKTEIVMEQFK